MINKKCNSENNVSSRKLAVLKIASSEKVALAKKYNKYNSEKVAYSKTNLIKK